MKPGTVLVFKNFVFHDGEISPQKLVLILAVPQKKNQNYLCSLTTSQERFKSAQLGCHYADNYFYIDARQSGFDKNTWIVFDKIYEFTMAKILSESFNENIHPIFDLQTDLWRAVRNCIVKSEDIELEHIDRIKKL